MTGYDAFLSYHWRDHTVVESIARRLQDQGVTVFLDRWYLVPGRPWPQALEDVLHDCRAVVVFLGPNSMGPWQQREINLALDRQARNPSFPVIPVLLPNADPALGFLGLNTWVDLRAGLEEPLSLAVLTAAVRGEPPGPELQEQLAVTLASICPYRGLRPFREEDAPLFFGREAFTERLVAAVARDPLVAVVGTSGSGKSSVVRAGLVPHLRRRDGAKVWDVVTLVPGNRPLHALAAALLPLLEPEMGEIDRLAEAGKLAEYLAEGHVVLRDVVARVLEKEPGTDRLLLVADQWEELYTLSREEAARRRFTDELLEATAAGQLSVVLTLRGDFFGHVLSYRPLADRLQNAVVNLGPMTRDELELAVAAPAQGVGLTFEPGLVPRLLDDVQEAPGNLPLLEFVLAELWEKRRGRRLFHDAYEAMGAVRGAIAARADETFARLTPAEQEATRRAFLQLVRPGEGTEDTRRRATMAEVGEAARPVVLRLAEARLLVTGRDEVTGEETIEVAHEALIQQWGRLRGWLDQDRELLLRHQRLRGALAEWERTGRDPGVLLRGAPLAEATRWLAERPDDLTVAERGFIQASVELHEQERQLQEQRRRRLTWAAMAVAGVLLLFAIFGWQQRNEAVTQRDEAKQQRQTADARLTEAERLRRVSIAQGLAAQGLSQHDQRKYELSALLARQAYLFNEHHQGHVLAQVDAALRTVLSTPYFSPIRHHHGTPVNTVAFRPNGDQLASGGSDRTVRLWDLRQPTAAPTILPHEDRVNTVAFSPNGDQLASVSADRTIRIWIARMETLAEMICEQVSRNLRRDEWHRFVDADLPHQRTCPTKPLGENAPPEAPVSRLPE
jgi:hypothetical protein